MGKKIIISSWKLGLKLRPEFVTTLFYSNYINLFKILKNVYFCDQWQNIAVLEDLTAPDEPSAQKIL